MKTEIWKKHDLIVTHEISNRGKVRSIKSGKEMKLYLDYRKDKAGNKIPDCVRKVFSTPTGMISKKVHRLVADCFLPPKPGPGYTIDHIDRNPFNNDVDNLRWATWGTQMSNRNVKSRGNWQKLSFKDLDDIYTRTKLESLKDIAKDVNIPHSDLCKLLKYLHPDY